MVIGFKLTDDADGFNWPFEPVDPSAYKLLNDRAKLLGETFRKTLERRLAYIYNISNLSKE